MKIQLTKTLLFSTLLSSMLLLGSGCGKKTVDSPLLGPDGKPLSGGTDINYPANDGSYSESSIPGEGTLDDTGSSASGQTGNLSVNRPEAENSDEYKRKYGRSSEGLSPVYYNFDQAGIRPDMAERMNNNAIYLKQLPGSNVLIEGNCDERGTNEYNLALGQRRALNAKDYLMNLGIEEARIRTVSYGEERPLFFGQDESAYEHNRRSDFILE